MAKSAVPAKAFPDPDHIDRLTSFVTGLYEEMDKLSKKAPSAPVSDLALGRVNRAIREALALLAAHDPYIAELREFVPAGENPEVRDSVLVLQEIKAGMVRYQVGRAKAAAAARGRRSY